ncbi:MAG: hypothetical protein ABJL67_21515, partial [Sulfitobacter sp.]
TVLDDHTGTDPDGVTDPASKKEHDFHREPLASANGPAVAEQGLMSVIGGLKKIQRGARMAAMGKLPCGAWP